MKSVFLRVISALFISILFVACGFKQEVVEINKYSIDFKTTKTNSDKKLETIYIEEPNVNRSFNQSSIFYSKEQFAFEEYVKNRWINLPSNMIFNQILDSLNSSMLFENVISKDRSVDYKFVLKSEVIKLYHEFEDDKSYSILKINFILIEDNKALKSFNFDKKILCDENSAYGFVKATNKAFEEVLDSFIEEIILISSQQ